MKIKESVRTRVSGIVFRRGDNGAVQILLHLARETKPKHESKKMQPRLPPSPRSWIAPTAKSHRSNDAYINLSDVLRKKCSFRRDQLQESHELFTEEQQLNGRNHYWLAVEMIDDSQPQQLTSDYFDDSRWFDHETIVEVISEQKMTPDWKQAIGKALREMVLVDESFKPLQQAFQEAR